MLNENTFFQNNFQPHEDIFVTETAQEFRYSDGGKAELSIAHAIQSSSDLSSDSSELEKHIKSWPTYYHLDSSRANFFRALNLTRGKTILEVGSGCGSISRYLAENSEHVVCVEGSLTRAKVCKSRLKGLDNVTVISCNINELLPKKQFDLVVCNGVLEYSPVYSRSKEAVSDFIKMTADFLDDSGLLILGIENKYGLKYFQGYPEDHTGLPFDGIQGYLSREPSPMTFSRGKLEEVLGKHYQHLEFYYPFPDYKHPRLILSNQALLELNPSELIAIFDKHKAVAQNIFCSTSAWKSICDDGLVKFFSNSFYVTARKQARTLEIVEDQPLIWWYSKNRKREYQVNAVVRKTFTNSLIVSKSLRYGNITTDLNEGFEHVLEDSKWITEESMASQIRSRLMKQKETRGFIEMSEDLILDWWGNVRYQEGIGRNLEGVYFDFHWYNYFPNSKAKIDLEWVPRDGVEPLHLVFRSVKCFFQAEKSTALHWSQEARQATPYTVTKQIASLLRLQFSLLLFYNCFMAERRFLTVVQAHPVGRLQFLVLFMSPVQIKILSFCRQLKINLVLSTKRRLTKLTLYKLVRRLLF